MWESVDIWNGTVFGDIPPNWHKEDFILESVKEKTICNEVLDEGKQSFSIGSSKEKYSYCC